jgi:hypothetical protein
MLQEYLILETNLSVVSSESNAINPLRRENGYGHNFADSRQSGD